MTHFETTIAELKAAGAEVVDPFAVPEIEPLQRGPNPARFKDDLAKCPKKGRNSEWRHPHDPDARITKMKDGRTPLAHKAEHAVDLETGAVVGVTVQGADHGDTTTIAETLTTAAEELEAVATATDGETSVIDEVVADKG